VGLTHESGWSLSAFPSGLVTWENVEDDSVAPRHRSEVPLTELRELWLDLAAGNIERVDGESWLPGYG
jgi:hypothetical protein